MTNSSSIGLRGIGSALPALDPKAWPSGPFDFISCTGLGEFLTDEEIHVFYENVHRALAPGGVFFTSAAAREPRADCLLREFELETNYRTTFELEAILRAQPWSSLTLSHDSTGLQTFVRAIR